MLCPCCGSEMLLEARECRCGARMVGDPLDDPPIQVKRYGPAFTSAALAASVTLSLVATRWAAVGGVMSLVRLLGFATLSCGCIVGRYREVPTSREVVYVEEKGHNCQSHGHRRNHTVTIDRAGMTAPLLSSRQGAFS